MKFIRSILFLLCIQVFQLTAQEKSTLNKLDFTGDFRFRIEQDWNSLKSDGTYRDNRTRLRYRLRFGFNYDYNDWATFGMRIRTGLPFHQQDPQITLGTAFKEFGTVPIGFEKLFFRVDRNWFSGWIGKNTYPFEKLDELFWSDNVYPEGAFASFQFSPSLSTIDKVKVGFGHFIMTSEGTTFDQDRYFQGVQLTTTLLNESVTIFPAFYYFHKMPNIPDGHGTYDIDYSIFQLGTKMKLILKPLVTIGADYYQNLQNLNSNDSIPQALRDQKSGLTTSLALGQLEEKGDWLIQVLITKMGRYAAVDFQAQNDWTRWDYSGQNSPAGRLTNFKGHELRAGYMIGKNFKLKLRYFVVEQLVPYGAVLETGNRIRLDLDIGF